MVIPVDALRPIVDWISSLELRHPTRVGLDGPSAAGKTTLADALAEMGSPSPTARSSAHRSMIFIFPAINSALCAVSGPRRRITTKAMTISRSATSFFDRLARPATAECALPSLTRFTTYLCPSTGTRHRKTRF
jgi:ATPase subunit of ABC transporter with duplicated ATPase domains